MQQASGSDIAKERPTFAKWGSVNWVYQLQNANPTLIYNVDYLQVSYYEKTIFAGSHALNQDLSRVTGETHTLIFHIHEDPKINCLSPIQVFAYQFP